MSTGHHSIEVVPGSKLSDQNRRELLEWTTKRWSSDSGTVRYSCPEQDIWFGADVEPVEAIDAIVSHGSGTIAGLQTDDLHFTISLGTGVLECNDLVTIGTDESTFKSGSAPESADASVRDWIALARQFFEHLDGTLAYATSEALEEPGGDADEIEFRMDVTAVRERRLTDVFWLMFLSDQFRNSIDESAVRSLPDGEITPLETGGVVVRLVENPLDFGPALKHEVRNRVLQRPDRQFRVLLPRSSVKGLLPGSSDLIWC